MNAAKLKILITESERVTTKALALWKDADARVKALEPIHREAKARFKDARRAAKRAKSNLKTAKAHVKTGKKEATKAARALERLRKKAVRLLKAGDSKKPTVRGKRRQPGKE